jgi:hypothetical protein
VSSHVMYAMYPILHLSHAKNTMSHTLHATNGMYAMYAINTRKSNVVGLSSFLNTFYLRKVGLKVCPKCFFTTSVNRFIFYFLFLPSHKKRNEKWDSFYTAKSVPFRGVIKFYLTYYF